MKVDDALITHVADVSRLKLSDEELKEFLPQLKEILDAFSDIAEADTGDTLPSYHPVRVEDHFREDLAFPGISERDAFSGCPAKDGYFKGPKIV